MEPLAHALFQSNVEHLLARIAAVTEEEQSSLVHPEGNGAAVPGEGDQILIGGRTVGLYFSARTEEGWESVRGQC